MDNKEFILETIKRVLPSTSWSGETNKDNEALDNIDLLGDVLELVLDNLFSNTYLIVRGNYSYDRIASRKQALIQWLVEYILQYDDVCERCINFIKDEAPEFLEEVK